MESKFGRKESAHHQTGLVMGPKTAQIWEQFTTEKSVLVVCHRRGQDGQNVNTAWES